MITMKPTTIEYSRVLFLFSTKKVLKPIPINPIMLANINALNPKTKFVMLSIYKKKKVKLWIAGKINNVNYDVSRINIQPKIVNQNLKKSKNNKYKLVIYIYIKISYTI